MNNSSNKKTPKEQPAATDGPPRPPKKTARGLEDQPPEEPHIEIPDPVVVRDLASALQQKPFRIIADLMEVGEFVNLHGTVGFDPASKVAWKYGFYARLAA
jgi:translation initiation factor IF-2